MRDVKVDLKWLHYFSKSASFLPKCSLQLSCEPPKHFAGITFVKNGFLQIHVNIKLEFAFGFNSFFEHHMCAVCVWKEQNYTILRANKCKVKNEVSKLIILRQVQVFWIKWLYLLSTTFSKFYYLLAFICFSAKLRFVKGFHFYSVLHFFVCW